MITKSYLLDSLLLDNLTNKYGKPIFSKTNNIYCFWKLDYIRINVYKSRDDLNKLKVVIQGKNIREDAEFLESLTLKNKRMLKNFPKFHGGGDEAGKGEDFGPLVITVIVLTEEQQKLFIKHNIQDSKKLSNDSVKNYAQFILKNIDPKQYCSLTINPSWINEKRIEGYNLHNFMIEGYNGATKEISQRYQDIKFDLVIDGFVKQNSFNSKHDYQETPNINIILETRAENKYISVACASILARYQYLKIIEEYDKTLKYTFPIGADFERNIMPFISFLIKNHVPYDNAIILIQTYIKNNLTRAISEYEKLYTFYKN